MAKKRANKIEKPKEKILKPLSDRESLYFKELVESSNRYTGMLKQKDQYEFAIKRMEEDRTKIQKDELIGPFNLTVIPKVLSRQVVDKKEILALYDEQLKTYKEMLKSLKGQIDHRREEFAECGVRTKEFMENRFSSAKVSLIVPDRRTGKEEEENLFEADFQKLATDPELQKKLKEANKEAVKRNVARKTKQ